MTDKLALHTFPIEGIEMILDDNDSRHWVAPGLGVRWTIRPSEFGDVLTFQAEAKGATATSMISAYEMAQMDAARGTEWIHSIETQLRKVILRKLTS